MKIIGITGGIGCGKSTVLQFMKTKYNAYIVEADRVAHQLMKCGQPAYEKIRQVFPASILADNGEIDRKQLSALVFRDAKCLKQLNDIVHPEVKSYLIHEIECKRIQKDCEIFVIEAALLIEDGYTKICDEIWYVYATEEIRIKRLMDSRGYTLEKCKSIMKNQSDEAFYRENTSVRIDNSISFENTEKQLDALLKFSQKCDKL